MWKADGLLVKPGFGEAGRCPGRCPIHENTIQNIKAEGLLVKPGFDEAGRCPINKNYAIKAEGLLVKPDTKKQDDILQKCKQHSKIPTARCRYQPMLRLKPNELES